MGIRAEEKTKEEIEAKLAGMRTDFNQIIYLESEIKRELTYDIKRFVFSKLASLYESRMMFDKAAKAMQTKAGVEITLREKIESYLRAGELYVKSGKLDDAEEMFLRAFRDSDSGQKQRVKLAMKNIFFINAQELEKKGKKATATKYYEKLIKMPLDELEKNEVKEKLIAEYRALGRFKDAELLEGM